jgi:DegT/DnrJ/EryC1/StrS aminotransferase family protein
VTAVEREIEATMAERLGRPCLFFPSGRLAVYAALRAWLEPGSRVLMSPLTDDVIFFVALAAGLRPVMAPVSPSDGNIDPQRVADGVWNGLGGVLTTNLYGLPDRVDDLRSRCDQLRIPLIEDAAHALDTRVGGRLIGTFGEAAAFSLSKHLGAGCGGILAFDDEASRPELEHMRNALTDPSSRGQRLMWVGRHEAERLVIRLHLVWPIRWLRRKLAPAERESHRMPLRATELRNALSAASGVQRFEAWVRVDRHDYRLQPAELLLKQALQRLKHVDADSARRIDGVTKLRCLPAVAPAVGEGSPQPLFRVPVLIDDRGSVVRRLERHLLNVGYIYDPPLDDYAGREFADPSPAPDAARSWARRVFPVDPLEADEFLRCMQ